jgi:hypothetical protein
MQQCFVHVPSLIEIGVMFHFKRFFPIYACKNSIPSCDSSRSLGTIISTRLNLHYFRKLSCKFELFLLSGSRENFSMTSSHFRDYLPLDENWTVFYSLHPRMICTKFNWNWPSGSEKNLFQCKYGFPYCGPSRPRGSWFE